MSKKLRITLDEEATKNYLEWVTALNQAHADEDLEWCGCSIRIELGGPYGAAAYSFGHIGGQITSYRGTDYLIPKNNIWGLILFTLTPNTFAMPLN